MVTSDGADFLEEVVTNLPALEPNGRLPAARNASGREWLAFRRCRAALARQAHSGTRIC